MWNLQFRQFHWVRLDRERRQHITSSPKIVGETDTREVRSSIWLDRVVESSLAHNARKPGSSSAQGKNFLFKC